LHTWRKNVDVDKIRAETEREIVEHRKEMMDLYEKTKDPAFLKAAQSDAEALKEMKKTPPDLTAGIIKPFIPIIALILIMTMLMRRR